MNPLQEHGHLFVKNFKAKVDYQDEDISKDFWVRGIYTIKACDSHNRVKLGMSWVRVGYCTLIARPISDMTNDEFLSIQEGMSVVDLLQKDELLKALAKKSETEEGLSLSWVNRLGKWGIYFGPQSHFEAGTVIDATKLQGAV